MQALPLPPTAPPSHPRPTSRSARLAPLAREATPRCGVCGCTAVRTDEVADRVVVRLAHCTRCDHRWTAPLTPAPAVAMRLVARPELRPAA